MSSIFLVTNFHSLHEIVTDSMKCVPRNLIGIVLNNFFEIENRFWFLPLYLRASALFSGNIIQWQIRNAFF